MNLRKTTSQILIIAFAVIIFSPFAAFAQKKSLTWTGCGITQKAFMQEIASEYAKKTGTTIILSGGGATKGVRAASAGTADMGGTCRHLLTINGRLNPEEKYVKLVQVAWDALVVITSKSNPVNNISLENLKKVYSGEINSWKDLGHPQDKRIVLCTRHGSKSGVGYMFRVLVTKNMGQNFKAKSLKFKSSGPLEKKISRTPTSLGVTGISSARKAEVKVLTIDGIEPEKNLIASGKYPLFRPLYIAVNHNQTPEVKDFIAFILSDEGQKIISGQGTVNLKEGRALNALWQKHNIQFNYPAE